MLIDRPEQLHAAFLSAFNRGQVEQLMALYEADASLLPQPGRILTGLPAIRQALGQFLALKGTMTMATTFCVEAGNLALLRGSWGLTGTDPHGNPVSMHGQSIEVARKQPEGHWLFVIDHPFGAD